MHRSLSILPLHDGEGMKKEEVVQITTQTPGIPLAAAAYRRVLRSGGYPIVSIIEDDFKLIQLQEGSDEQIGFFPGAWYRGIADTIDHSIRILADRDPLFLADTDPRKIIASSMATKPYREWLDAKEDAGKFTWTLCLYATEGVARQAGMSLEEYWESDRIGMFSYRERSDSQVAGGLRGNAENSHCSELHADSPHPDYRAINRPYRNAR